MWSATGRVKAYWVSVSRFIFTTPFSSAVAISSAVEPEPPWKTKSNGWLPAGLPYFSETPAWRSFSSSGRSTTLPGL